MTNQGHEPVVLVNIIVCSDFYSQLVEGAVSFVFVCRPREKVDTLLHTPPCFSRSPVINEAISRYSSSC